MKFEEYIEKKAAQKYAKKKSLNLEKKKPNEVKIGPKKEQNKKTQKIERRLTRLQIKLQKNETKEEVKEANSKIKDKISTSKCSSSLYSKKIIHSTKEVEKFFK